VAQKRKKTGGASLSGTNLERAGDHNQRVTLQAIRLGEPITRTKLGTITGLTPPAVANITKRLLDDGLIVEAGRLQGHRGLPATLLAVNPDGCCAVGVNIDRDQITAALVDFSGRVREQVTQRIDFPLPADVTRFFDGALTKLKSGWDRETMNLIGVGIAMPDDLGGVDLPHRPRHYDVWTTTDVKRLFSNAIDAPIYTENDAAAAALAELQFGAGTRKPSFFYILIAWGLGGSLVVEGECFRGADGRSGEIGFLPVRSSSGKTETLQDLVSLCALHERLAEHHLKVLDSDALAALPASAQSIVDQWIEDAADALIAPLINISCVINPQAVFIGGRLPTELIDRLVTALNQRLAEAKGFPTLSPVLRAETSASAPVIGAALLPMMDLLLPSQSTLRKASDH
jgi:predicted NBD/HSP70 family sugar kinase